MNKLNIKNHLISTNIKGLNFPAKGNPNTNYRSKSTKNDNLNKSKANNYKPLNISMS